MKSLVVFDSVNGNTEKIARSVSGAIAGVQVLPAGGARREKLGELDLLIVGAPTQGGKPSQGMQDFLGSIDADGLNNVKVAAFDTRMTMKFVKLFGFAAGKIADSLKKNGGNLVAPPEGFFVKGSKGPLVEGELARAAELGKKVSENVK